MYACLNRVTTGGGLPLEHFAELAAAGGFHGADVDMSYGEQHGAAALRDLFAALKLRFGGWTPPLDHRTDSAKRDAQ